MLTPRQKTNLIALIAWWVILILFGLELKKFCSPKSSAFWVMNLLFIASNVVMFLRGYNAKLLKEW